MLGKQFRENQFIWLMQWAYCEIRKAEEDTARLNLVGARSLEGLGALGILGLEGLLLFIYPRKKEFVVSELSRGLARGRGSKFSTRYNNRMLVV